MSKRLVKIGEAARLLGASVVTLRKWEATGELLPVRKTKGGTRYYCVADLLESNTSESPTICYARVSSHDQKQDLIRQQEILEAYCAAKGWREMKGVEIIIIHQGDQPSFEEGLAQDVLEIITVFSARLYGSRSHKNKKLMTDLQAAVGHA